MPLLAMMYPRGEKIKDEYDPQVIKHVSRLGAELGADIVKVSYTGSVESFPRRWWPAARCRWSLPAAPK